MPLTQMVGMLQKERRFSSVGEVAEHHDVQRGTWPTAPYLFGRSSTHEPHSQPVQLITEPTSNAFSLIVVREKMRLALYMGTATSAILPEYMVGVMWGGRLFMVAEVAVCHDVR